jgi:hypothetical protein
MYLAGLGKSPLPFDMFALAGDAELARRQDKLTSIYHRGQALVWDGQAVLAELLAKHGGIRLEPAQRNAIGQIMQVLMWGELAAWKIASQLADTFVPLAPKLAATSQAHDEARHFYVLHDYLQALPFTPQPLNRQTRLLLDGVLLTDNPLHKVMGMQLMIEALALTIFQAIRESQAEPVLCELLRYFEKDEARHVGLGVQYLPTQLRGLSRWQERRMIAFQVQLLAAALLELKALEPHMRLLGIDPRQVYLLGTAKQALVFEMLWKEQGTTDQEEESLASRLLTATGELLFPEPQPGQSAVRRYYRAATLALQTLRRGMPENVPASSIDPEAEAQLPSAAVWRS